MKIGYSRVSTREQNLDRQLDQLRDAGCERIFEEKVSGAKIDNRPELEKMMLTLREGDVVIISEISRLSRSVKDLYTLVDQIHDRGADIKSLKEEWLDTTTSSGKLLFTIMAGFAQFERYLIRERTKDGLRAARARGRKGGRPRTDAKKIEQAIRLYRTNAMTVTEIAEATGVKRSTLYQYIKA